MWDGVSRDERAMVSTVGAARKRWTLRVYCHLECVENGHERRCGNVGALIAIENKLHVIVRLISRRRVRVAAWVYEVKSCMYLLAFKVL